MILSDFVLRRGELSNRFMQDLLAFNDLSNG